ncbi:MAG TPA: LysE/ArgO family amino acid transporter [Albidovulum sp.]|uniref:LysE/ArgO family amino acid transporter n=1 Tax=Albidovulum sp. TaxID=1872424 RepID=UPI002C08E7CB|nr:LysE/ArgO family amino acid transporter [Albidovulum sp.]
MLSVFFAGFGLSLSLIAAIGAQNAFVLRQGLRREHVFPVALFCAASDAILIAAGIAGIGIATERLPMLLPILKWGGVAFLAVYGAKAFRAAWKGGAALDAANTGAAPLGHILLTLAAITWLNPHVYLDTVVLLGSIANQYPGREWSFGLGAALGSFAFFFALAYGARLLSPLFARPAAWRVLDGFVAAVMWSIALGLAAR